MDNNTDLFRIKTHFTALAVIIVAVLLLIDILVRVSPGLTNTTLVPSASKAGITAVGHHHSMPDGSSYYIYTIFETSGEVYQCWYDGREWNQKKVTNYKGPTLE